MNGEKYHVNVALTDNFPTKKNMHEITNYLADHSDPHDGCWVTGETASGNCKIKGKPWVTLTTPVFAYLAWTDFKSLPKGAESEVSVSVQEGFTKEFTTELKATYSVDAKIEIVNVKSELQLSFTDKNSWSSTTTTSEKITLKGGDNGEVYNIYQVVLVYANYSINAATACKGSFSHCKTLFLKDGLLFLSAVNTSYRAYIPKKKTKSTGIQDLALNNYIMETNSGKFSFNKDKPYRY